MWESCKEDAYSILILCMVSMVHHVTSHSRVVRMSSLDSFSEETLELRSRGIRIMYSSTHVHIRESQRPPCFVPGT